MFSQTFCIQSKVDYFSLSQIKEAQKKITYGCQPFEFEIQV